MCSVFEQDLDKDHYEIIVVDSSPDDGVTSMLEELAPSAPCSLRWLTKEPEGPGPSRQLGAEGARGEFIAFMDSDCEASPGWLRGGLSAFGDGMGIVQGRTLPHPEKERAVFTRYVKVERESHLFEGCNIFYRRSALRNAGPFSRDLLPRADHCLGGEDLEIGWRVKRMGWKSCFAEDALVYHDVLPISVFTWLVNKHLYIWPYVAKNFPELRRFFFARYFFDHSQASYLVALIGILLVTFHPGWLVLSLPYVVLRASEPTATLKGPLRLVRVLVYFPRDALSFLVLLAGSIRFRSLLL